MARGVVLLVLVLALAGCHGETKEGPLFNKNLLLPSPAGAPGVVDAARSPGTPAGSAAAVGATTTDGSQTNSVVVPLECSGPAVGSDKSPRDMCIWALIAIIDSKYYPYRAGIRALATTSGAIFDIVSLGLSTAATATGGAAAKTILSAINTGITGTKTALDSDYLYNKSIDIVTNQMDADRNEQLTLIINQMKKQPADYGMTQAKDDLLRYYEAGTFAAALESLQNKTASNAAACQAAAKDAKSESHDETTGSPACNPASGISATGPANENEAGASAPAPAIPAAPPPSQNH